MKSLLCVAYPKLGEEQRSLINAFREIHDQAYVNVIDPHWTMLFPSSCDGFSEEKLADHIRSIANQSKPIPFICRHALVYDDDSSDDYYLFLVPDEGFSGISHLHDELYTDFLRPQLRLDIPFVPHIGIATHKDRDHLYALAREWNAQKHEIRGTIDSLTLCSYDGEQVQDLNIFPIAD